MTEGKRPLSVGFLFALGHATIVFALAFLFAIGAWRWAGRSRTRAPHCTT
jgi:nickel/cobalt transporter (NiCoT) family protein